MNELTTIEVDLDVYKAIEGARISFDESHNDILQRILSGAPSVGSQQAHVIEPNEGGRTTGKYQFQFQGRDYHSNSQKNAYKKIMLLFQEANEDFLQKLSEHQTSHGRRIVAMNREALGAVAAKKNAEKLIGDYWFDTNLSLAQKKSRIQTACDIAKLKLGEDLVLNF